MKNHDSFDINSYLKEIDEKFTQEIDNLPPECLEAIMERAFHDTHELFRKNEQNDFKKVTYIIYRSYILGILMQELNLRKKSLPIKENNIIKLVK